MTKWTKAYRRAYNRKKMAEYRMLKPPRTRWQEIVRLFLGDF